ncbi:MAG: cyclic lactone autoinducer peptide [Oscillospiraceae bacterium]|nr:cyclic lactone autoinducer peptide [Oscillospiraceae bacterium]
MKLVKGISAEELMKLFASLALLVGISSMSQACFLAFNQPKVPNGMNKFNNEI